MIGRTLGRYTINSLIGEGGMASVYRASDPRLDREVAVKVIRRDVTSSLEMKRFAQEVRLAAGLQHPNIVPIHDVETSSSEGLWYYVMALVEGRTLRECLDEAGRLSVAEVRDHVADIASALDYAHRHGVVHRDIKPANILLSDGRAIVADFGLAKALGAADDPHLTRAGVTLGTPLYMSPEQASGEAPVDGRADIYSLGCVVYEALTGAPPYSGDSAQTILMAHMTKEVPLLSEARPDIPPAVERAVATALAKSPDERFPLASDFAHALSAGASSGSDSRAATLIREPSAPATPGVWTRKTSFRRVLLAAALATAATLGYLSREALRAPAPNEPTLAVMPFLNATDSTSFDSLGIGIAQTLATELSALPALRVVAGPASDSSWASRDPRAVARELGVSHLVRGSLQEEAGRLRVDVSLLGADSRIVWGGVYESDAGDLFELQRRISEGLGDALLIGLTPDERARRDERPTPDREAYAEYVQGRAFLERYDVPGNLEHARDLLSSAVNRDETFALAHAALGEARWQSFRRTNDPDFVAAGLDAAQRAKELDPDHPYVRYVLAVLYDGEGRTREAIAELNVALELQPSHDEALALLGRIHGRSGNVEQALEYFDRAIEGRPEFGGHQRAKGLMLLRNGRYRDAASAFSRVTQLQPDSSWGFQQLGVSYHYLGELDEALANYRKAVAIGSSAAAYSNMGTILYRRGDYEGASEAYEKAIAIRPSSARTFRNLGDAKRKIGREEAARDAYLQAIALVNEALTVNSRSGDSYSLRALYEAKLGREAEALADLERAIELQPNDVSILHRRAATLAILEREDEALDAIAEAIAEGASVSEIREDDSFDRLRDSSRFRALTRPN